MLFRDLAVLHHFEYSGDLAAVGLLFRNYKRIEKLRHLQESAVTKIKGGFGFSFNATQRASILHLTPCRGIGGDFKIVIEYILDHAQLAVVADFFTSSLNIQRIEKIIDLKGNDYIDFSTRGISVYAYRIENTLYISGVKP
jgi:hypothetical protein